MIATSGEDCHWSLPGGFTRPGSAQLDGQEGRVQPGPTQHQVITSKILFLEFFRQVVEMKAKEVMKQQLHDFSLLENITNNILPQQQGS